MDNLARQNDEQAVRMTRTFKASPARVFAAWSQPEQIAKWFGPKGYTMQVHEMDPRKDGKYRFGMTPPDGGQTRYIVGRYLEIEPDRRLVFSWAWQDDTACNDTPAADQSIVTVEFNAAGDDTEVVLLHERLTTQESRDGHRAGWAGSLDSLSEYLA